MKKKRKDQLFLNPILIVSSPDVSGIEIFDEYFVLSTLVLLLVLIVLSP